MEREFELVRGVPSEAAWDELTEALEARRAAGEDLAGWVEALAPELARWPEEVPRLLPLRWTYRLAARGSLPEAALANALLLSDRWAMRHFDEFRPLTQREGDAHDILGDEYDDVEADARTEQERVFQAKELSAIRSLDVAFFSDDNPYSPGPMVWLESPALLLAAPFIAGLYELNLAHALASWKDPGAGLVELLRRAPALRRLDLSQNDLGEAALVALAGCPEARRLQRLIVTGNRSGAASRRAFAAAGLRGVVEDLDDEDEDEDA
ncbi:hypothetical protein SAMN02745121_05192 [Nannocystis exedens]|uniref:Leucine Rich repeat-containing protein n=1 Tax=Nannocystis exedens TaxID=54 RepID=A0A1I2CQH2_9BACT|nr:leucine-rich repeat domain-containing protein [Nannocystis exedens]PCC68490.1 hypothetical protein NAEX_01505 [Nannocystis exedens]SFE70412.1 hypothetical protein SAMN02745121_05192 [Nannocystis exedens]